MGEQQIFDAGDADWGSAKVMGMSYMDPDTGKIVTVDLSGDTWPMKVHGTLFDEGGVPIKLRHNQLSQVGFIAIERGGMVYTIEEHGRSEISITSTRPKQLQDDVELLIRRAGPNRVVLGWREPRPHWMWQVWSRLVTVWRMR